MAAAERFNAHLVGARDGFSTPPLPRPLLSSSSNLPKDDLGPMMRISVWLMTGLAAIFLLTRLLCKFIRHRKLHVDDLFLIASWFTLMGAAIGVTIQTFHGFGRHGYDNTDITVADINAIAITGLLSITFTICSGCWGKTSWAITLLRVSSGKMKKFIWIAIITTNVLFIVPALTYWVQCTPLEKAWHPLVKGSCLNSNYGITMGIVASSFSGVLDLTFAIIPWWILKQAQMRPEEKVGAALAMSMGIFAAISAFIKCSALPELGGPDFSFTGVPLTIWGAAEPAVTIMAASLPMMRVLLQTTVEKSRRSSREAVEAEPEVGLADALAAPFNEKEKMVL